MKTVGILLVGGSSTRFKGNKNKQLYLLKNKPVFSYPLLVLIKSKNIDELLVVVSKDVKEEITKFVKKNKIECKFVENGKTRQESVDNALRCLSLDKNDIVVIHDSARPLIEEKNIKDVIEGAKECGASTTYIPETDTISLMGRNSMLKKFLNREEVAKIQTPQAFKFSLINNAHQKAKTNCFTDDCSLVKKYGSKVKLVLGSKKLHKITTQEDLIFLEGLLK